MLYKVKKLIYHTDEFISKQISKINCSDENLNFLACDMIPLSSNNDGLILNIIFDPKIKNIEGYQILTTPKEVTILAQKPCGAFYGINTLVAMLDENTNKCFEIEDFPDLAIRGVMLDISRSKVPSLETLKALIKMFAKLRYNHLQLYVEGFAFEYQSFKKYLTKNNYISLDDYLEVQAFVKKYYIDFVPNQNGLGHMSEWLSQEEFKNLAECADGIYLWGCNRAPSTLNPLDERSIALVKKMYSDMLKYTTSKYFNMNLDEPYELGLGKSKDSNLTKEQLYIDYFLKLYEEVKNIKKHPCFGVMY